MNFYFAQNNRHNAIIVEHEGRCKILTGGKKGTVSGVDLYRMDKKRRTLDVNGIISAYQWVVYLSRTMKFKDYLGEEYDFDSINNDEWYLIQINNDFENLYLERYAV